MNLRMSYSYLKKIGLPISFSIKQLYYPGHLWKKRRSQISFSVLFQMVDFISSGITDLISTTISIPYACYGIKYTRICYMKLKKFQEAIECSNNISGRISLNLVDSNNPEPSHLRQARNVIVIYFCFNYFLKLEL